MKNFKKDFPIFTRNPSLVYLDSAATSQKPHPVIDAVNNFYGTYNANIHRGMYPIAERATEEVEMVRKEIASFLNAKDTREIIFTHGTTEGVNIVSYGLQKYVKKDETILVTEMEHHSNLVPWQFLAKQTGARLALLPIDAQGILQIQDFSDFADVKVLAISHVSNVLGTINPIKKLIKKLREKFPHAVVLVDAAQSVSHMQFDVGDIDCDFLVFSSHKMFGPSGVGVLYGKKEMLEKLEPFILGSQMIREVKHTDATWADVPYRFEPGTLPLEGIIGMGAAIRYLLKIGFKNIREHEESLLHYAFRQLSAVSGLTIYGPENVKMRSGIISFSIDATHPHDVSQILGEKNICIRAGHHCAMPLHEKLRVPATCRISFSLYNTKNDIAHLVKELESVKKILQ